VHQGLDGAVGVGDGPAAARGQTADEVDQIGAAGGREVLLDLGDLGGRRRAVEHIRDAIGRAGSDVGVDVQILTRARHGHVAVGREARRVRGPEERLEALLEDQEELLLVDEPAVDDAQLAPARATIRDGVRAGQVPIAGHEGEIAKRQLRAPALGAVGAELVAQAGVAREADREPGELLAREPGGAVRVDVLHLRATADVDARRRCLGAHGVDEQQAGARGRARAGPRCVGEGDRDGRVARVVQRIGAVDAAGEHVAVGFQQVHGDGQLDHARGDRVLSCVRGVAGEARLIAVRQVTRSALAVTIATVPGDALEAPGPGARRRQHRREVVERHALGPEAAPDLHERVADGVDRRVSAAGLLERVGGGVGPGGPGAQALGAELREVIHAAGPLSGRRLGVGQVEPSGVHLRVRDLDDPGVAHARRTAGVGRVQRRRAVGGHLDLDLLRPLGGASVDEQIQPGQRARHGRVALQARVGGELVAHGGRAARVLATRPHDGLAVVAGQVTAQLGVEVLAALDGRILARQRVGGLADRVALRGVAVVDDLERAVRVVAGERERGRRERHGAEDLHVRLAHGGHAVETHPGHAVRLRGAVVAVRAVAPVEVAALAADLHVADRVRVDAVVVVDAVRQTLTVHAALMLRALRVRVAARHGIRRQQTRTLAANAAVAVLAIQGKAVRRAGAHEARHAVCVRLALAHGVTARHAGIGDAVIGHAAIVVAALEAGATGVHVAVASQGAGIARLTPIGAAGEAVVAQPVRVAGALKPSGLVAAEAALAGQPGITPVAGGAGLPVAPARLDAHVARALQDAIAVAGHAGARQSPGRATLGLAGAALAGVVRGVAGVAGAAGAARLASRAVVGATHVVAAHGAAGTVARVAHAAEFAGRAAGARTHVVRAHQRAAVLGQAAAARRRAGARLRAPGAVDGHAETVRVAGQVRRGALALVAGAVAGAERALLGGRDVALVFDVADQPGLAPAAGRALTADGAGDARQGVRLGAGVADGGRG
jgi:hypothetical protein